MCWFLFLKYLCDCRPGFRGVLVGPGGYVLPIPPPPHTFFSCRPRFSPRTPEQPGQPPPAPAAPLQQLTEGRQSRAGLPEPPVTHPAGTAPDAPAASRQREAAFAPSGAEAPAGGPRLLPAALPAPDPGSRAPPFALRALGGRGPPSHGDRASSATGNGVALRGGGAARGGDIASRRGAPLGEKEAGAGRVVAGSGCGAGGRGEARPGTRRGVRPGRGADRTPGCCRLRGAREGVEGAL